MKIVTHHLSLESPSRSLEKEYSCFISSQDSLRSSSPIEFPVTLIDLNQVVDDELKRRKPGDE